VIGKAKEGTVVNSVSFLGRDKTTITTPSTSTSSTSTSSSWLKGMFYGSSGHADSSDTLIDN